MEWLRPYTDETIVELGKKGFVFLFASNNQLAPKRDFAWRERLGQRNQVLLRYTVMKIYFTRGVFLKRKKGLGVERYKKDV